MLKTTRVAAYGILTDDAGRVLTQHTRDNSDVPDSWWLPGGGLDHGESPADAVVREVREETGLDVAVTGLNRIASELIELEPRWHYHKVAFVYDVKVVGGQLKTDVGELADDADNVWCHPSDLAGKRMARSTATVLGVEAAPIARVRLPEPPPPAPDGQVRRIAVYAWVTDPRGRVLLTFIPEGFWGAGNWHLPGGGLDFGEEPVAGLLREIEEETSQEVTLTGLRIVDSRHDPQSLEVDGSVVDFQGIHIIYDATVTDPKPLEVKDIGGSTSESRWFEPEEVASLPLTPPAVAAFAVASG